jgi:hypothetical protein
MTVICLYDIHLDFFLLQLYTYMICIFSIWIDYTDLFFSLELYAYMICILSIWIDSTDFFFL